MMKNEKLFCRTFLAAVPLLLLSGCVTGADGECTFAPIAALQEGVEKLSSIPDEAKASALEALAWLLGATGVGGGAAVLLQKGASYYRSRVQRTIENGQAASDSEQAGREEIPGEGAGGDVGS